MIPRNPRMAITKSPKDGCCFFFGCIIFLVGYIVSFTPAISGWSFYHNFEKEMAVASKTEKPNIVKEYTGDKEAIREGKEIFANTCAPCHNADAKGGIGPDLTTVNLKYGSARKDLYESIAKGRPNGMPSFLPQIGSEKSSKMVAFLETLRKK